MIKNIKQNLLKTFTIVFIITMIFLVWTAIFNNGSLFRELNIYVEIIGAIGFIALLWLIYKILNRINERYLWIIVGFSFITIIILQLFFIRYFRVNPSWDFDVIIGGAKAIANGDKYLWSYFYERYPNNSGITLVLAFIYSFVKKFTANNDIYLYVGYLLNIIMVNLSVYVIYKFSKEEFGKRFSALVSIFCIFVTPLYTYTTIVYTDTITAVFPILEFYLLYKVLKTNSKKKWLYISSLGVLAAIGTILKTNILISFIAIVIICIFLLRKVELLKSLIILLASFSIVMVVGKGIISERFPIKYEDAGFPYTHWIMMGLKNQGGYDGYDVNFTSDICKKQGKEAAERANIEEIKNRLKNYGVKGYLNFLKEKISFTWGDGTYYAPNKLRRDPISTNNMQEYVIGEKNQAYIYLSQFVHIVILIGITISGVMSYKRYDVIKGIQICIFGVFLFLILWETRSRYLVCYLPLMIFCAMDGFNSIFKSVESKIILNNS